MLSDRGSFSRVGRATFCVTIKVRPSPEHATYYEWQFGFLNVWVFAESAEAAAEAAGAIVDHLPYERVGESASVRDTLGGIPTLPGAESCAANAKALGIALSLISCATGVDEGDFETMECP